MNALFEAALEIEDFLRKRNWQFCIIGGLAVVRWGQPRATQDVDISLLTGFGSETQYVDPILTLFSSRISDAREFALESRVILAAAANGIPLDITLAGFPYEELVIARATKYEFATGVELTTASAEDLVVLKAFAGRDQDWADIQGIAIRQRRTLDWDYVFREFKPLSELKDDEQAISRLEGIRDQEP